MKKAWVKPSIVTYKEYDLLRKMFIKSQTGFTDFTDGFVDGYEDYTDSNGSAPGPAQL